MKRFDFRLKSVLLLRLRLLNEAEQRYTLAIRKHREAESKFSMGLLKIDKINDQVVQARKNRISGNQQEAFVGAIKQGKELLGKLEESVKQASIDENREKMAYIEANKNHELLLKLREHQHSTHVQDELLKEQLIQDDLFNARRSLLHAVN